MGFKNPIDVTFTGNFDVIGVLTNVKAIEVVNEAKIFEGWFGFVRELEAFANDVKNFLRAYFTGASEGKIVNLAE